MNQQLLAEIKGAYKALRLRPIRGFFFIHRKRYDLACPMVALALARGIVNRDDPDRLEKGDFTPVLEKFATEFSMPWVRGFSDGVDRQCQSSFDSKYLSGYEFGGRVAQEILPGESALGL
jgi:hypothetical protein